MSIRDLVAQINAGQTTARTLVQDALKKAKDAEEYHALLSLTEERALARADEIDARIKAGDAVGALAGVPFVVKDNFLAFGAPTTAASKMLENFEAPVQATVVEKLEQAGAICIGKSNLDA
ncbi:MAG TPA: amidase family protein, partial [Patescibacteria group bacterium]|nr:amidase family protein [Patescibacteria group bacterium]